MLYNLTRYQVVYKTREKKEERLGYKTEKSLSSAIGTLYSNQ